MALAVAAILPSCTKNDEPEVVPPTLEISLPSDSIATHATVTFAFGGDVSIHPMTRASLTELNLTDVWVFDYVGGQLQTTTHQTASDASFGSPSLTVDYGDHTFYFVASRGDTPTIDGTTISWAKPSDTFWATLAMDVQPSTSSIQSVTLRRVATRLRISIDDKITAQMSRLEVEPMTWYYGLNVMTGEGTDARQQVRSVTIPASYVGTTGQLSAAFFGLSPSDDWQTDVTVRLVGADESILGSVYLSDVRFCQNLTTVYRGGVIGTSQPFTVIADDEWLPDNEKTW